VEGVPAYGREVWNQMIFKIPSKPHHSMILYQSGIYHKKGKIPGSLIKRENHETFSKNRGPSSKIIELGRMPIVESYKCTGELKWGGGSKVLCRMHICNTSFMHCKSV